MRKAIRYLRTMLSLGHMPTVQEVDQFSHFTNRHAEYARYSVGDHTYGKPIILTWGEQATLVMGKYCSIASEVRILLGGNHRVDWVTTYPFNVFRSDCSAITGHPSTKGDVVIGSDVWIGYGATIMSGVTIGHGAVIAAGSVVTKDVGPYEVVGGNPVRVLRKRFTDEQIASLLKIRWWDNDDRLTKDTLRYMLSSDIDAFILHWHSDDNI